MTCTQELASSLYNSPGAEYNNILLITFKWFIYIVGVNASSVICVTCTYYSVVHIIRFRLSQIFAYFEWKHWSYYINNLLKIRIE